MSQFRILFAGIALLACVSVASAGSVTMTAVQQPNLEDWDFFAEVTSTDTLGLGGFVIDVFSNTADADTMSFVENKLSVLDAPGITVGFSFPSQGIVGPAPGDFFSISDLQTNLAQRIDGIGLVDVDRIGTIVFAGNEVNTSVPAYLGTLNIPGGGTSFNMNATLINLAGDGVLPKDQTQVEQVVIPIPEPSSIALLSIALLSLLGYRRRS